MLTSNLVLELPAGDVSQFVLEKVQNLKNAAVQAAMGSEEQPVVTTKQELDELIKKERELALWKVATSAGSLLAWLGMVLLFALFYRVVKADQPINMERAREHFQGSGFTHGAFACLEDLDTSLWSCCCFGARWADTMSAAGLLSFWVAVVLFLGIQLMQSAVQGLVVWAVAAMIFTYFRQQLRTAFALKNDGDDQVKDFALWCCCFCCALVQEARQVKLAAKLSQDMPV